MVGRKPIAPTETLGENEADWHVHLVDFSRVLKHARTAISLEHNDIVCFLIRHQHPVTRGVDGKVPRRLATG